MLAVVLVMTAAGKGKRKLINMAGMCAVMAGSVIWCFPIAFTGQRILPAVANDIYRYEIEEFPDAVPEEMTG